MLRAFPSRQRNPLLALKAYLELPDNHRVFHSSRSPQTSSLALSVHHGIAGHPTYFPSTTGVPFSLKQISCVLGIPSSTDLVPSLSFVTSLDPPSALL